MGYIWNLIAVLNNLTLITTQFSGLYMGLNCSVNWPQCHRIKSHTEVVGDVRWQKYLSCHKITHNIDILKILVHITQHCQEIGCKKYKLNLKKMCTIFDVDGKNLNLYSLSIDRISIHRNSMDTTSMWSNCCLTARCHACKYNWRVCTLHEHYDLM